MANSADVVYQYDGSFEGLLCCVFESFTQTEIPMDIIGSDAACIMLYPLKAIVTDEHKAARVLKSIPDKIGQEALEFIQHAFLSCMLRKELYILQFLRLGFRHGPSVMNMLALDVVDALFKAVTHLKRESHLLKGFIRFSVTNNALVAEIEPKNCVLPMLAAHFCSRYPEERFLIHDKTNGMALVYQPYRHAIVPVESVELPEPDQSELDFRELWRLFYDTIAIEGRLNPKCRMSHMPKRYWKYMTEFGSAKKELAKPALVGQSQLPDYR